MEEVEQNTNGSIDTGTDGDVGIPKVLDNMKHMNGQCVTGKPFDQCEVSIKDKNGTTSTQNGDCDISAKQVQKVQIKTDPVSISLQKDYGSEYSNSYKNDSNSVETDAVENNIKPVIPIAKVMAKARNSLKDLAAKVLSSPDRRPDSETSIADENEKEEDHNKVLHDSNGTEIDSKECKPEIKDENTKTGVVAETGEELDLADVDKESRLEDDLLNPNLEEGIHMEIASDSEDFLLQLSPDQETDSYRIKKEVPAELNIKTVSDNDDKSINADHVKGRGVLNHDSSIANSTESVQSAETSDVLDKYNEGCVKKKEMDSCNLNSIKHEKDVPQYSRSALEEVHDKTPLGENHRKDTHEMSAKVVEIDITPEKSPQKKDSRKDDEDDDDVIFEGESKVDLSTRYKEPAHKDPPVKDNSIDKSKTETEKSEQIQTPKTNENPITPHIIEDDDDVIFEKETKIDLSVQNICKENTNQLKSKENGYERKKEVPKTNENSEAVVNGTEPKSKPICDKNETLNTSSPKSADNKSSIIERKRAAEESQLTSSDSKRSKLEPTCSTKEIVSSVEEPASIDIIDSDEDMDTTEHSPNSVPEKDTTGMLSEEKEDTKMITLSAEMLEALVRKKVKEYLAVQRDALLTQMSQKLQDFQSNNDLWKRQVKDLQVKVNDVTVLQQKHEKRKAHTAALRQITTRNVAVQVDDGRTGGTKIKSHVVTASQSSPLLTIPKAPPPGPGRIVTSPPGGTGTIRLPIPQSSIAPPIMTPMITHQPVTTDFKTPTVKSLLGTTRTQPTISSVAMTSPTSSAPIISTQHPRVVTTTTAAPTYISLPQVTVTSTSTKIITNPNGKAKIIDLTEDEPRLLVTTPQAVAPAGGTGVRTILSQGSQIVHAGFPNTSGTIQLVLASGSQPLKPGTIITGLPPNLIQSLPQTPVTGANLTSPNSSQTVVVTTVVTHPRPAAPPLLQSPTPVQSLVTGIPTAQVTGLASVPVSSRASAPVMGIASIPVTRLASAPVTNLASVPVKGQALAPVMGAGSVPVTSLAAVPVTGLAPAKTISQTPALTSAPSTTTKVVGTSPGQLVILPNKHPAPFPLMNTLQKAEPRSLPPKPSLRVSRVNQVKMRKKRIANHSEDEIMTKRQESVPRNTQKNNKVAAEMFKEYLREKNKPDNFEEFDEVTLAEALGQFYLNARTKSGELYKASTFETIRYSLNRYLKSPPYLKKFNILTSDAFNDANEYYKTAIIKIKESGKGEVQHYQQISESDLKKLYNSTLLSPETPTGLLNRVQLNIRLFFCRRANNNMEKMTKATFAVAKYEDGTRYIVRKRNELTENQTEKNEYFSSIMPEDSENAKFCPVETFLLYLSKLNPNIDRLWQYPRDSFNPNDDVWYQNRPIGRDTLSSFMQSLSRQVQLSRVYTNQCVTVTGTNILSPVNFSTASDETINQKNKPTGSANQKMFYLQMYYVENSGE